MSGNLLAERRLTGRGSTEPAAKAGEPAGKAGRATSVLDPAIDDSVQFGSGPVASALEVVPDAKALPDEAVGLDGLERSRLAADFLELTKPRIVSMILIVTALSAVFMAGRDLQWLPLLHLLLGTALVAASAGVLNQVWEHQVDGRMARTRMRPLPAGRVSRWSATLFGLTLITVGTAYLTFLVGATPAMLGVVTWLLYVFVYTPMKTRTSWNTAVGAIAGALPMQMGYTAAGGSLADLEGWLLFGVLLLWQYPHFMAIAWMYRYDYGAAGLQMSPVVDPSGRSAGRQAVAGSILLMLVLVALVRPLTATGEGLGISIWGIVFAVAAVLVTAKFVLASLRFASQPDDLTARRLLRASLVQLPAAMLVLVLSALI